MQIHLIKFYFIFSLIFIFQYNVKAKEIEDIIGHISFYKIKNDQDLIEISRSNNLAFPEVMQANKTIIDPWVLESDKNILLPSRHILPDTSREGIIVNKGDLRIYYYSEKKIYSYPIGIGRQDWETPVGSAIVTGKKINPYWTVPKSILLEEPHWPKVVKPGPDNPLGTRAIYLSMAGYLLHGTNKPWGVGMKVSHGCIRLYPEDIEELYEIVKMGTKVTIVDQKVKAGWQGGVLYLEVHSMHRYGLEDGEEIKPNMRHLPAAANILQKKAGIHIAKLDWSKVTKIVKTASGKPEAVLTIYD